MKNNKSRAKKLAFIEAAILSNTDECIIWPYLVGRDGYAVFCCNYKNIRVSRLVCEKVYGKPPPEKPLALHAPVVCHNPRCINPRHLFWESYQENCAHTHLDETCTETRKRKLSREEVAGIFFSRDGVRSTARKYGVNSRLVYYIKSGQHLYARELHSADNEEPRNGSSES
jgi:hypothetical protein